jgi:hypothetical protein
MAEYVPIIEDDDNNFTAVASATITGGQILAVTGTNGTTATVGPAGAASVIHVGVAKNDAASGAYVTVHRLGIQLVTASGTVTAGDVVIAAANGQVATGSPTVGQTIGVALTTATTGNKVRVLFTR